MGFILAFLSLHFILTFYPRQTHEETFVFRKLDS
ncbi:Uncharacterised protein [Streptococcus pyogenes]|nr:Uncharacterised protein [Streptococcus pyogenes]